MSRTPKCYWPAWVLLIAVITGALMSQPTNASASPPPPIDSAMRWYRWHPTAPLVQRSVTNGTAVLGVVAMRKLAQFARRYDFHVVRTFPMLHAAAVTVTRSLVLGAPHDRRIRYLSLLGKPRRLTSLPNDPLVSTLDPGTTLPYEWQFEAAHIDRALDRVTGSEHILVGTIDSGAADVPDLVGKVDARWTVSGDGELTQDRDATDIVGHGTAVASLIAANVGDGFGMAGFGGASHLIVVRAWTFTDLATAAALMKLDLLSVRIVNMSFGGDAPETPIMLDAIRRAAADGMLLVAAAGNSSQAVAHPASDLQPPGGALSYGLAVGASDIHGNRAWFSNAGANLSLLAPGGYDGDCGGVLVASTPAPIAFADTCYPTWAGDRGSLYAYVSGTSFAAPEVAGAAALVWAVRPELKNYQVADILKQSARRAAAGWTPAAGFGVLDADAAVELALSESGGT